MTEAEDRARTDHIRDSVEAWFTGFGYWRDEESRESRRGPPNIYQRRVFEHVRRCMEAGIPCRMVGLKYRRAGSSTCGNATLHHCGMNHEWRMAVIGTDYKASANMLDILSHFAEKDDFPGWKPSITKSGEVTVTPEQWGEGGILERSIATKLEYQHGSSVELYTSKNPESARSAGLNAYLATEVGRWATGGEQDAGDTLTAMRNTLPKKGFHVAFEESTANGAAGAFYETCRGARWPEYATWWKQWETVWPLEESNFGRDLQFVFIFAGWHEDERHVEHNLTPAMEAELRATLDADEKQLIARYGQDGPQGQRLGSEVNATVWQQLAWRRGIIKNVCVKGGKDEFSIEYPASPDEAFKASGSPALDREGLSVIEAMARNKGEPYLARYGTMAQQSNGTVSFDGCEREQCTVYRWEEPIIPLTPKDRGGKYVVSCDPMSGADTVTGGNEKDRHSVFVLRDAYVDHRGEYHAVKVVARLRPPCEWATAVLTRQLHLLSLYYGGATITVEANIGAPILVALEEAGANCYYREIWDDPAQKTVRKLGYMSTEPTKRILLDKLQMYVHQQLLDLRCLHAVGELLTYVIDAKGKAKAGGSNHDDDCVSLSLALVTLPHAHEYPAPRSIRRDDPNVRQWRLG